jgi:uncharacterized membrane protein YccC
MSARAPWTSTVSGWIRAKDPGLLAVKRSVRAAVFVPGSFAVAHALFANGQIGLFAAFGSFALMLFVDFPGRPHTRLVSYVVLVAVGAGLIALGTLVSTHAWPAVVSMAVVGFAVLFTGILAPQVATASTATLLTFVLPVAVAQPAGAIGPRLLGWAIAAAFCVPACMLLWPTPWHDELRRRLSGAMAAVGRLVGSGPGPGDPEAQASVRSELARLRQQFQATPYPPTGAAGGAVAVAKLVGRVEWVAGNAVLASEVIRPGGPGPVQDVIDAVAETLDHSASLICDGGAYPVNDPDVIRAVRQSTQRLDTLVTRELDAEVSMLIDPNPTDVPPDDELVGALSPSFRARAFGIATEMVADATLEAAGAQRVGDRRLGEPSDAAAHSFRRRLRSHLSLRSVWFRNAVRGAVGLALAVGVVEVTDVEHGFWVVLGTLSVLRSNALGTGATALRAVGGTAVGFVVGGLIMVGLGGNSDWLWALLPLAVLVSGVAPSMISFAAGQAGFTVVVVILFNIIDPIGWRVGLTRIEDVAIGCGVSIVVGFLFWPRGATAALGRALSDAFVESSGYLSDAVDRLTSTGHHLDIEASQRASHRAYLRLDDAFRQFLAEKGAKVVPVETVADLLTGSNRIRLAAYTLTTLPAPVIEPGQPELESVAVAGAVLRDSYALSHRWYEEFAEMLTGSRTALDVPPGHDETLRHVLVTAFEDARTCGRADRVRTMLQMLWADELLEIQRQFQSDLAGAADLFARRRGWALTI